MLIEDHNVGSFRAGGLRLLASEHLPADSTRPPSPRDLPPPNALRLSSRSGLRPPFSDSLLSVRSPSQPATFASASGSRGGRLRPKSTGSLRLTRDLRRASEAADAALTLMRGVRCSASSRLPTPSGSSQRSSPGALHCRAHVEEAQAFLAEMLTPCSSSGSVQEAGLPALNGTMPWFPGDQFPNQVRLPLRRGGKPGTRRSASESRKGPTALGSASEARIVPPTSGLGTLALPPDDADTSVASVGPLAAASSPSVEQAEGTDEEFCKLLEESMLESDEDAH